jgi:3-methylcrotonyl-CoA carboxylase alpha subunit
MATVTRVGAGVYRVDGDGRQTIVYVAGSQEQLWAFSNGEIFREHDRRDGPAKDRPPEGGHYSVNAPMPATVVKVLVAPGQAVRHGDTLVVVEAMKMELPIRAPGDATVKAVNCREGELVQPDRALVELE